MAINLLLHRIKTGSLQTGLVFVGISLLTSALLILVLRKNVVPEAGVIIATQANPAAAPIADIGP
jgi:LPXTG-motif cell wall-anchored protein